MQKPYLKYPNGDVYDRFGKHITAEEAAKIPNFWDQVEDASGTPPVSGQKPYIKYANEDVYDRQGNHITEDEAKNIPGFWGQVENSDKNPSQTDWVRFETDPTPDDSKTNQQTVWLYNVDEKTYRPIESIEALKAFTGVDDVAAIYEYITVLPTSTLRTDPSWEGSFISSEGAIKADGKIPTVTPIIPNSNYFTGVSRYGVSDSDRLPDNAEQEAASFIGNLMTLYKDAGLISQTVLDTYVKDPANLQKYVNAVLYGGYDVPTHIFSDLRAKTLVEQGQTQYKDYKGFDDKLGAAAWGKTSAGQEAMNMTELQSPDMVSGIDVGLFKNPIFQIPAQAFQTLVKPLDITSPEFKKEAEKIEASYYDALMQNAQAQTEQEKALADDNYQTFKKNLEKKYGIQLSNNSKEAWGQIQQLISGGTERGLSGSGILREAQDQYMKGVRDNNQLLRESKLDEAQAEERSRLLNSASSEEIAAFINASPENRQKAQDWGLIPSEEQRAWYSVDNLKAKYPNLSDEQIQRISSLMIDENGNYRSKLYQNLFANKYGIQNEKQTYQENQLMLKKLNEEQKAYDEFTLRNGLSSYYDENGILHTLSEAAKEKERLAREKAEADKNAKKPYYSYEGESDIYDANTNKAFESEEDFINAGGVAYWKPENAGKESNVDIRKRDTTADTSVQVPESLKFLDSSKDYYRKEGTNEVYDKKTNQHVSYEDAVKNNIWDKIEDIKPSTSSTNNTNSSSNNNKKKYQWQYVESEGVHRYLPVD